MMRVSKYRMVAIFVGLVLLSVIGCGGGGDTPQPVSGTVTVKGGKPLSKGIIRFSIVGGKKATSAFGTLDANGAFQLSSLGTNDGALVGDYTVTLEGTETGRDYDHPNDPVVNVVDEKYTSNATTDLKFTVKPGRNTCKFEVDPPAAAAQ